MTSLTFGPLRGPLRGRIITLLLLLSLLASSCSKNQVETPYVIILSLDGCRWDYPDRADMPNLATMAKEGVKAKSIIPCYPSKTFPNHYSLATGLYPDHHGIVQNSFWDPELGRRFTMGNRSAVEDSIFWEGEAIWETAERQGVRTAAFFWVGTESNETYRPSIRKSFDDEVPFHTRIDSVVSWLYKPEKNRPHLILFYFEEPDGVGHSTGPESPETGLMLHYLDSLVGVTMTRIDQAETDLGIQVNFIVTSDHGMGYIPPGNYVFLADYIDTDQITRFSGGNPCWLIDPKPEYLEAVYRKLKRIPHLKVWKKGELPERYHYGSHPRISQLVVEAEAGWGVEIEKRDKKYSLGTHGYDPKNRDMQAIFYAEGPAFKSGYTQPSFDNVDLYPLLAHLLKIKPAQTDGSLKPVRRMLKRD